MLFLAAIHETNRHPFAAAPCDVGLVKAAVGRCRKGVKGGGVALPQRGHLLSLAITLLGVQGAHSEATRTWNGASTSNSNWMTAANWGAPLRLPATL